MRDVQTQSVMKSTITGYRLGQAHRQRLPVDELALADRLTVPLEGEGDYLISCKETRALGAILNWIGGLAHRLASLEHTQAHLWIIFIHLLLSLSTQT